jgi:3-phenylpropionate/cinnamic acid dioxygenase small subunit
MSETLMEVMNLLARQSHAIDSGDSFQWAQTFTVDGSFSSPTYSQPVHGRSALIEFAAAFARDNPRTRHLVTNVLIEGQPTSDECHARANLVIAQTKPSQDGDTVQIHRVTTIHDQLVRREGGWQVAKRRVTRD